MKIISEMHTKFDVYVFISILSVFL